MATYITRQTLTPIQGGTRSQPIYETASLSSETGQAVERQDTYLGNKGRMTPLLMGSRVPQATGYEGIALLGSAVTTIDTDPSRKYKLLQEQGIGRRQSSLLEEHIIFDEPVRGDRVNIIRSGVGTFGIQYQQTIVQNGDKRIRRWPRDWHGDNMKN